MEIRPILTPRKKVIEPEPSLADDITRIENRLSGKTPQGFWTAIKESAGFAILNGELVTEKKRFDAKARLNAAALLLRNPILEKLTQADAKKISDELLKTIPNFETVFSPSVRKSVVAIPKAVFAAPRENAAISTEPVESGIATDEFLVSNGLQLRVGRSSYSSWAQIISIDEKLCGLVKQRKGKEEFYIKDIYGNSSPKRSDALAIQNLLEAVSGKKIGYIDDGGQMIEFTVPKELADITIPSEPVEWYVNIPGINAIEKFQSKE